MTGTLTMYLKGKTTFNLDNTITQNDTHKLVALTFNTACMECNSSQYVHGEMCRNTSSNNSYMYSERVTSVLLPHSACMYH